MAVNEPRSAESAKILDEILKRYGLSPKSTTQTGTEAGSPNAAAMSASVKSSGNSQ